MSTVSDVVPASCDSPVGAEVAVRADFVRDASGGPTT